MSSVILSSFKTLCTDIFDQFNANPGTSVQPDWLVLLICSAYSLTLTMLIGMHAFCSGRTQLTSSFVYHSCSFAVLMLKAWLHASLQACIQADPAKRPTCAQLLNYPFFQEAAHNMPPIIAAAQASLHCQPCCVLPCAH